jgi:hypothetical protein
MPKTSRSISSRGGPLALAIGFYLVVRVTLRLVEPDRPTVGPRWLVPGIEVALLLALAQLTRITSPGAPAGSARWESRSSWASSC